MISYSDSRRDLNLLRPVSIKNSPGNSCNTSRGGCGYHMKTESFTVSRSAVLMESRTLLPDDDLEAVTPQLSCFVSGHSYRH